MSHTPGPWTASKRPNGTTVILVAPCGRVLFNCYSAREADNRLVLAAPDLLVALEKAVALYGKPGGPWSVPHEPGAWITLAENAIKKAKGEKSE